jgi:uncharacterized protein (DUF433 family)
MGFAMKKAKAHPYISYQKDVCSGSRIITGTRIPVWSLISWYKTGMSVEDIIKEFPQLSPAQVHDAFSYYYDNTEEIEKDIEANKSEPLREKR